MAEEQIFRNLKSFRYHFYLGNATLEIRTLIKGGTVHTTLENVPTDQYGLIVEDDDQDPANTLPQLRIIEN